MVGGVTEVAAKPRRPVHKPDELPSGRRLDSLTGLRFFAAFAVFLDHINGAGNSGYARVPWLYPQSLYGAHGVAFFFVLSGFVLTWSWRRDDTARAFYWRRFARIYPAHFAATAIAIPVFYWYSHVQPGWGPILLSVFLLQAWFIHLNPAFPGNPVSWTLSCEMFFYAVFPWVIRPLARARVATLAFAGAFFAVALLLAGSLAYHYEDFSTAEAIIRMPLFTVGQFLIGICLALAMRRGARVRLPLIPGVLALTAWIYLYYNVLPHHGKAGQIWELRLDQFFLPLLCAWIIGAAAQRELDGKRSVLQTRPLVLLGAWSYSFYLVHKTVIRLPTMQYGDQHPSNSNIFDVLGLAVVATAAAAALYYLVEHPAERWLRAQWARRHRPDEPGEKAVERPTAHDVEVIEEGESDEGAALGVK
jgi:peptidoglycan/LPS O-acetylase OafA/YrhL